MRYKAYFFDLFGTLVDIHTDETMPALWKGLAGFYSSCGAEWNWRDFRDRFYRVWKRKLSGCREKRMKSIRRRHR